MTHVFWGVKLSAFAIKNSYAINVSYVSILLPKFLINSYGSFKYFLYNVFEVPLHAFGVSTFGPVLYLRIKLEISIYFLVHLLRIPPLVSNLFMLPPTLFTPTLLLWKSIHCLQSLVNNDQLRRQRQIASVSDNDQQVRRQHQIASVSDNDQLRRQCQIASVLVLQKLS